MFAAADHLRPVNVAEGDIVCGRKAVRREGVQRTDIDFANRLAFAGTDGG